MISLIRQWFCNYELKLVKQNDYSFGTMTTYICPKCGYTRKVKTYPWWVT